MKQTNKIRNETKNFNVGSGKSSYYRKWMKRNKMKWNKNGLKDECLNASLEQPGCIYVGC